MRRIEPPNTTPVETATAIYRQCAQAVQSVEKTKRLLSAEPDIAAAAEKYVEAATRAALHEIVRSSAIAGIVTKKEMMSLYKTHMARKAGITREVYDHLMSAPRHKRCPLCGQRVVSTLDHHLPKSEYPAFSIFPHNLIPVCGDCNKNKHTALPKYPEFQTIHPYFDNFETERWLYGKVVQGEPVAIKFFVEAPVHWDEIKGKRAKHHFKILRLNELYASHAAEELTNIRHRLTCLYREAGIESVQQHLEYEAESKAAAHVNSWQTATYEALASDDWFFDGSKVIELWLK